MLTIILYKRTAKQRSFNTVTAEKSQATVTAFLPSKQVMLFGLPYQHIFIINVYILLVKPLSHSYGFRR